MKCHKLIFNKNIFRKNIGSITIVTFFIIYLFCLINYMIKGIEQLKFKIQNTTIKREENDINNDNIFIFMRKNKVNKTFQKIINKKDYISTPPNKRRISKNILSKNINNNKKKCIINKKI